MATPGANGAGDGPDRRIDYGAPTEDNVAAGSAATESTPAAVGLPGSREPQPRTLAEVTNHAANNAGPVKQGKPKKVRAANAGTTDPAVVPERKAKRRGNAPALDSVQMQEALLRTYRPRVRKQVAKFDPAPPRKPSTRRKRRSSGASAGDPAAAAGSGVSTSDSGGSGRDTPSAGGVGYAATASGADTDVGSIGVGADSDSMVLSGSVYGDDAVPHSADLDFLSQGSQALQAAAAGASALQMGERTPHRRSRTGSTRSPATSGSATPFGRRTSARGTPRSAPASMGMGTVGAASLVHDTPSASGGRARRTSTASSRSKGTRTPSRRKRGGKAGRAVSPRTRTVEAEVAHRVVHIDRPLLRRTLLESDRFRDVSRGNDLDRVPGADPQSAPYLSSLDEFMRIVSDEDVPVYAQMPRWARMTTDPADIVVVANNVSMPRVKGRDGETLPVLKQSKGTTLKCGVWYKRAKGAVCEMRMHRMASKTKLASYTWVVQVRRITDNPAKRTRTPPGRLCAPLARSAGAGASDAMAGASQGNPGAAGAGVKAVARRPKARARPTSAGEARRGRRAGGAGARHTSRQLGFGARTTPTRRAGRREQGAAEFSAAYHAGSSVMTLTEGRSCTLDPNPTHSARFTVSPALPAGLKLNQRTGVITGTPQAALEPAQLFQVRAHLKDGVKNIPLRLEVVSNAKRKELQRSTDSTSACTGRTHARKSPRIGAADLTGHVVSDRARAAACSPPRSSAAAGRLHGTATSHELAEFDDIFHPADFDFESDTDTARPDSHTGGWPNLEAPGEDFDSLFLQDATEHRALSAPLPGSLDEHRSYSSMGVAGALEPRSASAAGAVARPDARAMQFAANVAMPLPLQHVPQHYMGPPMPRLYNVVDNGSGHLAAALAAAPMSCPSPTYHHAGAQDPSLGVPLFSYTPVMPPQEVLRRHSSGSDTLSVRQAHRYAGAAGAGAGDVSPLLERSLSTPRRVLAPPSLGTPGSWGSAGDGSLSSRGRSSVHEPGAKSNDREQ